MKRVYFDNAASAPLNKKAKQFIQKCLNIYGNPSSSHIEGRLLRTEIDMARIKCAQALGCSPEEIFFTSGASESNSWAHKIWNLTVDERVHDSLKIHNYNCNKVYAVSLINNETGGYDYNSLIRELCTDFLFEGCNIFLDLTSAIGHCYINLHNMSDVVGASLSGHKFGALQGVGLLYIRKDQQDKMKPLIYGHQENGMRGGTENLLGIISLGIAITEATENMQQNNKHIKELVTYIYNRVPTYRHSLVLGSPNYVERIETHNHIINITFRYLRASTVVMLFDKYGVAVSAGSACNSDTDEPSAILLEEDYSEDEALRTIRVSLGHQNTLKECKRFIKVLKKIIDNFDSL